MPLYESDAANNVQACGCAACAAPFAILGLLALAVMAYLAIAMVFGH